jgi:hypothetical protein
MDSLEEGAEEERIIDRFNLDCCDFFATLLLQEFPELSVDRTFLHDFRLGLTVSLPVQSTYPPKNVDGLCRVLRDRLFWEKDILIPYVIEQTREDA